MHKYRKILLSLFITALLLTGCKKGGEEDLGEIKSPDSLSTTSSHAKAKEDLLMKLHDGQIPDLYKSNTFQSITIGDKVNLNDLEQSNIIVGRGYFISNKNAHEFVEKQIKYVKGDLNGMINTYHQLLSKNKDATVGVNLDEEGNLLINFTSFSPTAYILENRAFQETFINTSPEIRDVSFLAGAEEMVLKGYYKTIKANFPEVKYVYFQLGGSPWEAIKGEVHDGLLFMEPGQARPAKAPVYLRATINDNYDAETGFSNNYTGDRQIDRPTEIIVPTADFTENEVADTIESSHDTPVNDEEKTTKFGAPADKDGKDVFENEEATNEYLNKQADKTREESDLDSETLEFLDGRPMTQEEIDEMNRENGYGVDEGHKEEHTNPENDNEVEIDVRAD